MPHIIVKLYSGRSEREKSRLANEITAAVMKTLGTAKDRSLLPSRVSSCRRICSTEAGVQPLARAR
jgi:Tautomerase enzyme